VGKKKTKTRFQLRAEKEAGSPNHAHRGESAEPPFRRRVSKKGKSAGDPKGEGWGKEAGERVRKEGGPNAKKAKRITCQKKKTKSPQGRSKKGPEHPSRRDRRGGNAKDKKKTVGQFQKEKETSGPPP